MYGLNLSIIAIFYANSIISHYIHYQYSNEIITVLKLCSKF